MNSAQKTASYPLPPGNMGLPLVGETLSFVLNPQDFSQKHHQQYGSIFKTCIFTQPTIFIAGAEACHFVLENENIYFQNELLPNIKKLIGKSALSVQTGEKHQNRRNLLRKTFSNQYLASQIVTIEAVTQSYFERWKNLSEFSWYPELRNYAFDVACKLFVGVNQSSELGHLLQIWSEGLFSFSPSLPWTKVGRALDSRNKILNLIEKIVDERQEESDPGKDALGILLQARDEESNSLSREEIKDQILNLLFAGHETVASALTSFCFLLAQHPEVLEKCRQEQQKFSTSGSLTFDTLSQMDYLEQVLKEVLRKSPPVGGGFRKVIKDCSFDGYQLPKGWRVIYEISLTHQNPTLFSEPNIFNPERFNPANQSTLTPGSYIPYGGGRRRCLGENLANLEMKIFAAKLIGNYDWKLLPNQNLETEQFPLPHPRDGLKVSLQSRKNDN